MAEHQRVEVQRRHEWVAAERLAHQRTLRENFDLHRKNHALRQYEQTPEPTQAVWRREFLATLAPILQKRYVALPTFGFEDPYYRAFVMQHKLAPLTLDDYLAKTGLVLDADERRALQTR